MPWTPETRVEPTDAGLAEYRLNCAFLDTLIGMCEAPRLTEEEIDDLNQGDAERRCPTCGDTGSIPAGYGGNCEIETNCPDCTPDWR